MNLTLGCKIKAILAIPITLLLVFGIYSYFEMKKISQLSEKLYKHPYTVSNSVRDLKIYITEMQNVSEKAHQGLVSNKNIRLVESLDSKNKNVLASFALIKKRFLGDKVKVISAEKVYKNWYNKNLMLIELASKNQPMEKIMASKLECARLLKSLSLKTEYLLNFANSKGKLFYENSKRTNKEASVNLAVFLFISTLMSIMFSYFTVGSINKKLRKLTEDLFSNASQVSVEAKEIAVSSSRLSETSTEQASSLQETASSLEELSAMVKNNVSQAEASSLKSHEVNSKSLDLQGKMNQIIKSMEEITKSNEDIVSLVKVIEIIGDKTRIIDDIVFQTKILSFNASVEAERAGEHGRGFSVVAQEVSKLAEVSGSSSREISQIVKTSIEKAKNISDQNFNKVKSGNEFVKEAATALLSMSESSSEITQSSENILIASQDQSEGIAQVNQAVSQLDQATQQNASLAEQSASAGAELNQQSAKMMNSLFDLIQIIDGKKRAMSKQPLDNVVSINKNITEEVHEEKPFKLSKTGTSDGWSDI